MSANCKVIIENKNKYRMIRGFYVHCCHVPVNWQCSKQMSLGWSGWTGSLLKEISNDLC